MLCRLRMRDEFEAIWSVRWLCDGNRHRRSSYKLQIALLLGVCCFSFLGCSRGFPSITTTPSGLLTVSPPASSVTANGGLTGTETSLAGAQSAAPSPPSPASLLSPAGLLGGSKPATLPKELMVTQSPDIERQIRSLDASNKQLNAQLAQTQQQVQFYKDRADLMQRQLADVSGKLPSRVASNPLPYVPSPGAANASAVPSPTSKGFGSSNNRRSGARLTANVSRGLEADPLRELGYEVDVASDGLRLRIPSDQLFQPNSSQLTPSGTSLLDRVAEILKAQYSDRRVAIEGYTDNAPLYGGMYSTSHQLTSAQTDAILEQWTRRNQLAASQFVTLAHGSNHPIADNQNPAGRASNRRIEVLIRDEGTP